MSTGGWETEKYMEFLILIYYAYILKTIVFNNNFGGHYLVIISLGSNEANAPPGPQLLSQRLFLLREQLNAHSLFWCLRSTPTARMFPVIASRLYCDP